MTITLDTEQALALMLLIERDTAELPTAEDDYLDGLHSALSEFVLGHPHDTL